LAPAIWMRSAQLTVGLRFLTGCSSAMALDKPALTACASSASKRTLPLAPPRSGHSRMCRSNVPASENAKRSMMGLQLDLVIMSTRSRWHARNRATLRTSRSAASRCDHAVSARISQRTSAANSTVPTAAPTTSSRRHTRSMTINVICERTFCVLLLVGRGGGSWNSLINVIRVITHKDRSRTLPGR